MHSFRFLFLVQILAFATAVTAFRTNINHTSQHCTHKRMIFPKHQQQHHRRQAQATLLCSSKIDCHGEGIPLLTSLSGGQQLIRPGILPNIIAAAGASILFSVPSISSAVDTTIIISVADGSTTTTDTAGTTFGQWFFLLYVVVSLLAGAKEVLVRIKKQMDKED